jgi:hypothetical protein
MEEREYKTSRRFGFSPDNVSQAMFRRVFLCEVKREKIEETDIIIPSKGRHGQFFELIIGQMFGLVPRVFPHDMTQRSSSTWN